MKNILILLSIIPTLAFSQNLINQQSANPQLNIQLINFENNVGNLNVNANHDLQYMQMNENNINDNNPIAQADAPSTGGGISLPKLSLPAFAWKPTAAGGGKAKKHKAAKKIFKSKKKLKKIFGKTRKIKATASCFNF